MPDDVIDEIIHFRSMPAVYLHNQLKLLSLLACLAGGCLCFFPAQGETVLDGTNAVGLKLGDYVHEVFAHNESVQAQMLETEVNRHKERAEKGVFSPQFETSVTWVDNQRTNNTEQQAAQGGQAFFSEYNKLYDGGIEQLIPIGGTIRLGASMSSLYNNVNPNPPIFGASSNNVFFQQYQTFVGATYTQPLLKDFGFTPTLAAIRLAALDSDIAFQQYRRQLMLTLSRAESAYWNLYFAQEQLRFFDDSVAVTGRNERAISRKT